MRNVRILALDLAKRVFHLCGVNHAGGVVYRKKVRREELLGQVLQLSSGSVVVMEACGSSNYWAKVFQEHGYVVRMIAPQHVKAFRKSQKNDANDAEAIAEAAQRPTMRFVEPKTPEQQEHQILVRVREERVCERTKKVNQLHGILLEFGFAAPEGVTKMLKYLGTLLCGETELSPILRGLLLDLRVELEVLSDRIKELTRQIESTAKHHPICQLLLSVPGIGPIGALAFSAAVPNAQVFRNGRNFAAWLGIVPRQHSTGGRTVLGSITKSGDCFLRKTLIHGARAVLRYTKGKTDPLSLWAQALLQRKRYNVVAVALANKLARIMQNILVTKRPYQASLLAA